MAIKNVEGKWKAYAESDLRLAAPGGRWEGRGVRPREAGRTRKTKNSQMLTEKQVEPVRFHRLHSGRKNGTRSVCTRSGERKEFRS